MKKVLYLPLNYGDVVQSGMYDAFKENNILLEVFDYFAVFHSNNSKDKTRSDLLVKCLTFRPDILHMQIQHTDIIDAATIKIIKDKLPNIIIINWTGDVRNYVPDTYKSVAKYSDINLISSTGQIDMFEKEIGKKIGYLQIGHNPKLYYPTESNAFDYNITFTANYNPIENYPGTNDRVSAVKLLDAAFGKRFGMFGIGWNRVINRRITQCLQYDINKIYQKSFCLLSISHYNNISDYFSDRLLMCLASGRPTISLRFPNCENYFVHNEDIIYVDSIYEIKSAVDRLLADKELANKIGRSGYEKVSKNYTYKHMVAKLLNIVDEFKENR